MRPNKRFHATVLALRARPAREPRRSAQMQRGRRGIPRYHPGRSVEGGFEGAACLPGREQDERAAASMVLLHHPLGRRRGSP